MHPHSGIGIITYFEGANLLHEDTTGQPLVLKEGGQQWIKAGAGVWHDEHYQRLAETQGEWLLTIHQLWVQLPKDEELAKPHYYNNPPEKTPMVGKAKVIAGSYQGQISPLPIVHDLTYLDVTLEAGEEFTYPTPSGQTRGFIFPRRGSLKVGEQVLPHGKLGILEEQEGNVTVLALEATSFVMVTAAPQNTPVVTGGGSIHSTQEALESSRKELQKIGRQQVYI